MARFLSQRPRKQTRIFLVFVLAVASLCFIIKRIDPGNRLQDEKHLIPALSKENSRQGEEQPSVSNESNPPTPGLESYPVTKEKPSSSLKETELVKEEQ